MMTLYSGTTCPFSQRCRIVFLEKGIDVRIINVDLFDKPESLRPTRQSFPPVSVPPALCNSRNAWLDLQTINRELSCDFYEGVVAKRADSLYPVQLRSPEQEFPFWVKHRWRF